MLDLNRPQKPLEDTTGFRKVTFEFVPKIRSSFWMLLWAVLKPVKARRNPEEASGAT